MSVVKDEVPTTAELWAVLKAICAPTLQAATVVLLTYDGQETTMTTYIVPQTEPTND